MSHQRSLYAPYSYRAREGTSTQRFPYDVNSISRTPNNRMQLGSHAQIYQVTAHVPRDRRVVNQRIVTAQLEEEIANSMKAPDIPKQLEKSECVTLLVTSPDGKTHVRNVYKVILEAASAELAQCIKPDTLVDQSKSTSSPSRLWRAEITEKIKEHTLDQFNFWLRSAEHVHCSISLETGTLGSTDVILSLIDLWTFAARYDLHNLCNAAIYSAMRSARSSGQLVIAPHLELIKTVLKGFQETNRLRRFLVDATVHSLLYNPGSLDLSSGEEWNFILDIVRSVRTIVGTGHRICAGGLCPFSDEAFHKYKSHESVTIEV